MDRDPVKTKNPLKTAAELNDAELRSIRRLASKTGRSTWTTDEIALRIGCSVETVREVLGPGSGR